MLRRSPVGVLLCLCFVLVGFGQTTEFTFQGKLNDAAAPASGNYDLTFDLWDDPTAGTHFGATVTKLNVPISNGVFTVTLDFGNQFPGAGRYLQIGVRQSSSSPGAFTPLSPRQAITSVPYAIRALNPGPPGPAGPGALWANVRSDGLLLQHSAGITSSELRTGVYRVTFPQSVTGCALSISESQYLGAGIIGVNGSTTDPPDLSHRFLTVVQDVGATNAMVVGVRDASTRALVEGPFSIMFICS